MPEGSKTEAVFFESSLRSHKHTSYFPVYDNVFQRFYGKDVTLLEIGVLNGGSLQMWRKLFGDNARLIGVDLNPSAKQLEAFGFEIFIGDQSDEEFLKGVGDAVGGFDIVIDDGGHTYDQQVVTTAILTQYIRDGGLLLVEDTHTSYMRGFGSKRYSFINYVKNKIDQINFRSVLLADEGEKIIWSIQVFESIVLFNIDRRLCGKVGEVLENSGDSLSVDDYRYNDSSLAVWFKRTFRDRNLPEFINAPARVVFHFIFDTLARLHSKAGKYFRG